MLATRWFEGETDAVPAVSALAGSASLRYVGGHGASRMKQLDVTHGFQGMVFGLMFLWQK